MKGLGSLVFWALLSLSAVVVNSYGQTPTPMVAPTPFVSVAPPNVVWPSPVQRVMPGSIPAQAVGKAAPPVSSPVPTIFPKGYIPPPLTGPVPGGH